MARADLLSLVLLTLLVLFSPFVYDALSFFLEGALSLGLIAR